MLSRVQSGCTTSRTPCPNAEVTVNSVSNAGEELRACVLHTVIQSLVQGFGLQIEQLQGAQAKLQFTLVTIFAHACSLLSSRAPQATAWV